MVDPDAMESLLNRKGNELYKLQILRIWFRFKSEEPDEKYYEVNFDGKTSILSCIEIAQLNGALSRLGSFELNLGRECTKEEYDKWKEDFHG